MDSRKNPAPGRCGQICAREMIQSETLLKEGFPMDIVIYVVMALAALVAVAAYLVRSDRKEEHWRLGCLLKRPLGQDEKHPEQGE